MSSEKATRRLRFLLSKAKRLGLGPEEVVELPAAKKLLSARGTTTLSMWTILTMIALIFTGSMLLVWFCAPCISKSET